MLKDQETHRKFHLNQDEIDQFEQDGFAVVRSVVSPAEVKRMYPLLTHLFERFNELPKTLAREMSESSHPLQGLRNPDLARCLRLEPKLAKTQYFQHIWVMARQLLGSQARLCFDHAILKPPHSNCPTPWHQDEAYDKPGNSERRISVWLPLQDVSAESGCLQYIPGSHKRELVPHYPLATGTHALMTKHVASAEAVLCPVNVGDLIIHSGRTLHYAGPNITASPRLAWILVFAAGGNSPRARLLRLAAPILSARW